MRSATTLRMPFSGVTVVDPASVTDEGAPAGAGRVDRGVSGVVARSATLTRPPIPLPVPVAPWLRAALVAGFAARWASTSRAMTRPWGPDPWARASWGRPDSSASARARGETAPSEAAVANVGTGMSSVPVASDGDVGAASGEAAVPSGARTSGSSSSPSSPRISRGSLTGTSSPSSHRSFRTVPASVLGTCMVALSVSIEHKVWSTATVSPGFTAHSMIRQDSTELPSWGITTMVAMGSSPHTVRSCARSCSSPMDSAGRPSSVMIPVTSPIPMKLTNPA